VFVLDVSNSPASLSDTVICVDGWGRESTGLATSEVFVLDVNNSPGSLSDTVILSVICVAD
jgi:hypothetical protein